MSTNPIDTWVTVPRRLRRCSQSLAPGVWWVRHEAVDASRARALLLDDDFAVVPLKGDRLTTMRQAQAAIAAALRLPGSAAVNLDGLVDALRDLDLWWPRTRRIVLLWSEAQVLREADPDGFAELVSVLSEAHESLWRSERDAAVTGDEHERVLETVLVPASDAAPMDPTDPAIQ
ncbi:barstar family protein [Arsenicicoccus cauae]|uniref:barstar family protein n=1 Tax=Arsenicicoccus cauae TaxID=2663847 RepID=UPI00370D6245